MKNNDHITNNSTKQGGTNTKVTINCQDFASSNFDIKGNSGSSITNDYKRGTTTNNNNNNTNIGGNMGGTIRTGCNCIDSESEYNTPTDEESDEDISSSDSIVSSRHSFKYIMDMLLQNQESDGEAKTEVKSQSKAGKTVEKKSIVKNGNTSGRKEKLILSKESKKEFEKCSSNGGDNYNNDNSEYSDNLDSLETDMIVNGNVNKNGNLNVESCNSEMDDLSFDMHMSMKNNYDININSEDDDTMWMFSKLNEKIKSIGSNKDTNKRKNHNETQVNFDSPSDNDSNNDNFNGDRNSPPRPFYFSH